MNETDPRSYGLLGDISVGSTGVESDGQTEGPMNGKMVTGGRTDMPDMCKAVFFIGPLDCSLESHSLQHLAILCDHSEYVLPSLACHTVTGHSLRYQSELVADPTTVARGSILPECKHPERLRADSDPTSVARESTLPECKPPECVDTDPDPKCVARDRRPTECRRSDRVRSDPDPKSVASESRTPECRLSARVDTNSDLTFLGRKSRCPECRSPDGMSFGMVDSSVSRRESSARFSARADSSIYIYIYMYVLLQHMKGILH